MTEPAPLVSLAASDWTSSLQSTAELHVVGGSYGNLWCVRVGQMELTSTPRWPFFLSCLCTQTSTHTLSLSLPHTHTHTPSNTQAHAQHVCSRHPASHKPLPPNIPHIWPFNCGPKISVITESVSTLQVNTAAEIDTSTTIYKCAGARGRFLFIADWN